MSYREPANSAQRDEGATTGGKGSPVPVDLSHESRAWAPVAVVLAGPVVWSVHFMVVYLAVEAGCNGEGPGFTGLGPPVPTVVTLVATVVAAIACVASAAWGYRWWRAAQREHGAADEQAGLRGSLALAGFLLSLLGVIAVALVGLPALVLPAC